MIDRLSKTVPVKLSEVVSAFDFVSAGDGVDAQAYICVTTGTVHWISDAIGPEEDSLPDGFEESDDYIAVPHKRELDLGSRLVFAFAEQAMPDDYDTIRDIFRRKGAYRRLKDFLDGKGMLHTWYDFEVKATEEALRAWCGENDIALDDG